jgi:OOP family OmpA-OmpF porin
MHVPYFKTVVRAACVSAAMSCLGAGAAHAEGLYVGASLATPHFGDNIDGLSIGNSGVSGKLFGGYQLSRNFALEAGVADLGRISDDGGSIKAHGEYLDAVGLLPLNESWSLLGSVGVAHVNIDTSNGDDNGAALKLGLGAEYALNKSVALRGEYEAYRVDAFNSHSNIGQYSLGVRVSF